MTKEGKKKEKGGSSKDNSVVALLLAENWSESEAVLGHAWSLAELGGASLLDHGLESLSRVKPPLREVLVATKETAEECGPVAAAVKAWQGRWESLRFFSVPAAQSLGDVLRAVDEAGEWGKGDILMMEAGALAPPAPIQAAIDEHRSRRLKDKCSVLTLVMGCGDGEHPSRLSGAEVVIGRRGGEGEEDPLRVHLYEEVRSGESPPDSLRGFKGRLDSELLSCGVAVASAQIPPLFSGENVDFSSLSDVVKEILVNEEIHGFKAHLCIPPPTTPVAWAQDLVALLTLTRPMLEGWFWPMGPDWLSSGLGRELPRRDYRRLGAHWLPADTSKRPRTAQTELRGHCLLSQDVSLAPNSLIHGSCLGEGVGVGEGAELRHCIVGAGAKVAPHSRLSHCLILPGSSVPLGSTAGPWSVLRLADSAPNHCKVPSFSVFASELPCEDSDLLSSPGAVKGTWNWLNQDKGPLLHIRSQSLLLQSWLKNKQAGAGVDGEASEMGDGIGSDADHDDDDDDDDDDGEFESGQLRDAALAFLNEVKDSLERGLAEKTSVDNLKLEINSSKFAHNVRMEELCQLLGRALVLLSTETNSARATSAAFLSKASQLLPLFHHYFGQSQEGQIDFLTGLEEALVAEGFSELYAPVLPKILHWLYDKDAVSEDALLAWFQELEETTLTDSLQEFMNWLQNAEEEED